MRQPSEVKSAGESSKLHRIYVGSIPGHIRQTTLLAYFQAFGKIVRLRMFYRDVNEKVNKGYCHVITDDRATYDRILAHSPHYLGKRRLYCSALISGRRLEKHNLYNNTKRIILRNLPPEMTDDDLYSLVSAFGAIEMAYIFKAHGLMRQNFAFTPTASVQFVDSRVAHALVNRHLLETQIAGKAVTLVVYPYIHNYNELKDAVMASDDAMAQLPSFEDPAEQALFNRELPEYLRKEELILKLKIKQEAEKRQTGQKVEIQYEENPERHQYRPTQKHYFEDSKRFANTLKVKGNYVLNRCKVKKSTESGTLRPAQSNPQCSDLFSPNTVTPRKEDDGSRKDDLLHLIRKDCRILDLERAAAGEEVTLRQSQQGLHAPRTLSIERHGLGSPSRRFLGIETAIGRLQSAAGLRSQSSRKQDFKYWTQPLQNEHSQNPQIYSYF